MSRVHGVDGCSAGWAVVSVNAEGAPEPTLSLARDLAQLVASGQVVAVDIPVGLPERVTGPGRAAEQAIRPHLGARQSSVFSMPARAAVYAGSFEEACRLALATSDPPRKVSRQGFHLFPKVRELDGLLCAENQRSIFEVHAEMAFWRLNCEAPMPTAKRVKGVPTREGLGERITLLERHGFPAGWFDKPRPQGLPLVDVVDAAAIALIARRCAAGIARPFPDPPDVDARGLRIAIWA
jgi:predicted RNase H-like nuclease